MYLKLKICEHLTYIIVVLCIATFPTIKRLNEQYLAHSYSNYYDL